MTRRAKKSILINGLTNFSPDEYNAEWESYEKILQETASDYDFSKIKPATIESSDLFFESFQKGDSDSEGQLVVLKDKKNSRLCLNMDGIFGVARIYNDKNLFLQSQPIKSYWFENIFKYIDSQISVSRQVGMAIIGDSGAILDVQLVLFLRAFLKRLGLENIVLSVNSSGCPDCRPPYKNALSHFFAGYSRKMCSECRALIKLNPLLVFHCKLEKCKKIIKLAPQFVDHLCEDCQNNLKEFLECLDELKISYRFDHNLVSNYNFASKNIFDIYLTDKEGNKEIKIARGERIDTIFKHFTKHHIPMSSLTFEIEKISKFIEEKKIKDIVNELTAKNKRKFLLIQLGQTAKLRALKLFEDLREFGVIVGEALSRNSIKSQMKQATKFDSEYLLIIGQKEALNKEIILREINSGNQEIIKMDNLTQILKKRHLL